MSLFKNESGQVRLVWRLILIILLYTTGAVLLRFLPIRILTAYLVGDGITHAIALEKATELIIQNPVWSTSLGLLFGSLGLLIVWVLITKVEKSTFRWKAVGLEWKHNSFLMILLGALIALLIYFGYILTRRLVKPTEIAQIPIRIGVSIPIFFHKLFLFLIMGFGEEIVFRGYIQTRGVKQLGATWGILLTAVIFVLLHQVFYSLSLITILSGMLLWFAIGLLFLFSKSLYLSITFHGVMNTLMNTLDSTFDDTDSLIMHAFLFFCVIVFGIITKKFQILRRKNL